MTVLVVGHTGYVGRSLLRWFNERGVATAGLARTSLASSDAAGCVRQFVVQDLHNEAFTDFMRRSVQGVVILSADTRKSVPPPEVPSMVNTNVSLPAQVGLIAGQAEVSRVVFASTYSIQVSPIAYSPQTLYSASKKAAEDLLEFVATSSPANVTSLRFYDIYGPNQPHDRFIPYLVRQVRHGIPVSMTSGEQEMSPVFIQDVCSAIAYCLSDPEGDTDFRIRSVFGPESIRARELPQRLADAVGYPCPLVNHDRPARPREAMMFSPSHALPLGWSPRVRLDDGLRSVWAANST